MSESIEYEIVSELIRRGWQISFAESCTAGLAASRIVNVPDASYVLSVSFVTYSNEAKMKYVGVQPQTLETHGAVSEEVAKEMAIGAANAMGADVGVGISGIAGPGGGTPQKPVGTVCFGYYLRDGEKIVTETMHFPDEGRQNVREAAAEHALEKVVELLGRARSESESV